MNVPSGVTLGQLRALRAVARHGSFTLAADELCLSQPAVSVQIRELERECGVALFNRTGRRVALTQEGEVMLACARDVLRRLEEARQEMDDLRGIRHGTLALAAAQVVGVHILPEILSRFKERYPGIKITLRIAFGREVTEQVLAGSADLGLLGERESLDDTRIEVRRFRLDELVVVVSGVHPWADRTAVDVDELGSQPFIISHGASAVWQTLEARLRRVGVALDTGMQFGNSDGVKRAVEVGLGISVMPRLAITRQDQESGRIRIVPLRGIPTEFGHSLIWLKRRRLPSVVTAFLAFLDIGTSNTP